MKRFVVISGCSGGGKSTLLEELGRRGYAIVPEPGRRIIAEQRSGTGQALPWVDLAAFARRAMEMALLDWEQAKDLPGFVFFDRGLIDAVAALEHATGMPAPNLHLAARYNPLVFMTPPWPELYATDADRQHGLDEAIAEYERLLTAFSSLGYTTEILPKASVSRRADIVIEHLGLG